MLVLAHDGRTRVRVARDGGNERAHGRGCKAVGDGLRFARDGVLGERVAGLVAGWFQVSLQDVKR